MDSKSAYQLGSFCSLPFVHQEKSFDGRHHICCYANQLQSDFVGQDSIPSFNSTTINNIRQKMLNGERPAECNVCYKFEDIGGKSPRQIETESWINLSTKKESLDNNIHLFVNAETLTPTSLDLRYSNTCTLNCRMCNSGSSSSINQEYAKLQSQWPEKFWTIKNPRTNHEVVLTPDIQKVYLAGGEPLVEPYNLDILTKLADCKPDVILVINTSLNYLSDKFLDVLNRFTCLTFTISLDGTDKVNDYIRHGSKFDVVSANIEKVKHHSLLFGSCISMYNIFNIRDLINFVATTYPGCEESHGLNRVNDLEELFIDNVPPELRPELIADLTDMLSIAGSQVKTSIQNIIVTLQQDNFDPERFENFKKYTRILDASRNESIIDIEPKWTPYFK